jgi:hypothetical protein
MSSKFIFATVHTNTLIRITQHRFKDPDQNQTEECRVGRETEKQKQKK